MERARCAKAVLQLGAIVAPRLMRGRRFSEVAWEGSP